MVEGGARGAGLRRLQPERAPQDRLRDLVGAAWTNGAVLPNTDLGSNPIFRSYPSTGLAPGGAAIRYFPDINGGLFNNGESLPTTNRQMKFRLTVRDGKGGVNAADTTVNVVNNSAQPFLLTEPSTGAVWQPNTQKTVRWNVANTNQAPYNCANVKIEMTNSNGGTIAVLNGSTPNDGSETVTVPVASGNVLIKVSCTDQNQIFFAVTNSPGILVCSDVLLNDNHEDGQAGWTVGGNDDLWTLRTNDAAKALSGQNYWFATSWGFDTSTLTSQTFTATSNNTVLRFMHSYKFVANHQSGKVVLRIAGQGDQDLTSIAGQAADYPSYKGQQIDLTGKVTQGQNFQIIFRRDAGFGGISGDSSAGWFLDDVSLCSSAPVSPPPPTATHTATATSTPSATPTATETSTNTPNAPTDTPTNTPTGTLPPDTPTHTPTSTPTATPSPSPTPTPTATTEIVVVPGQARWTGGGGNDDWNNGGNWDSGRAPDQNVSVIIPGGLANYPTIRNDAAVNNIQIDGGARVDMSGGVLSVHGNWGGSTGGTAEYCQRYNIGEAGSAPKRFGADPIADTIVIPNGGQLTDLDVYLNIDHVWAGDIVARLKHETSDTQITLFDPSNDNCEGDQSPITFDDEAAEAVVDACVNSNPAFAANRYRPNQALSAFDGATFAGAWTLDLSDVYPAADDGFLNEWCLQVTVAESVGDFVATGGTVRFLGAFTHALRASADSRFNHLAIGDGATVQQVSLGSDVTIDGNLTIRQGAQLSGGAFHVTIKGNWNQADGNGFQADTSQVIFAGNGTQTLSGDPLFAYLVVREGSLLDVGGSDPRVAVQLVNDGAIRQTKAVAGNDWVRFIDAGGYLGVDIHANGGDLGDTTVSIRKSPTGCLDRPGVTIQRCFTIEPTNVSGNNVDIRFYYAGEEQLSNSCSNMDGYQLDTGTGEVTKQNRYAWRCAYEPRVSPL